MSPARSIAPRRYSVGAPCGSSRRDGSAQPMQHGVFAFSALIGRCREPPRTRPRPSLRRAEPLREAPAGSRLRDAHTAARGSSRRMWLSPRSRRAEPAVRWVAYRGRARGMHSGSSVMRMPRATRGILTSELVAAFLFANMVVSTETTPRSTSRERCKLRHGFYGGRAQWRPTAPRAHANHNRG